MFAIEMKKKRNSSFWQQKQVGSPKKQNDVSFWLKTRHVNDEKQNISESQTFQGTEKFIMAIFLQNGIHESHFYISENR